MSARNAFLVLLWLPFSVLSQQAAKERTWILKLNVPQLVDVLRFPTVSFAVEKKFNRYLGVNVEAGYQLYQNGDMSVDTTFFKQKGYKVNAEVRVYLIRLFKKNYTGKGTGLFTGVQGFYRWNQYNSGAGYAPIAQAEKPVHFEDEFGVRKKAVGANFIVGYQYTRHRVVFEPFAGFGFMRRTITNFQRQFNPQTQEQDFSDASLHADLEEDSGNFGNFTIGFRIGLTL